MSKMGEIALQIDELVEQGMSAKFISVIRLVQPLSVESAILLV